ncbi:intraflagellar transport protein 27 homolog [Rhopilema esculentum]|uniref:intraflagellar transport protein 27 homolog n=1 Tax=Rhopilema esculentum TaxID=499914 RepID=UPI0031CE10C2|eukprot:gene9295-16992_t
MVNLRAKCLVCGDTTVGKTALVQSFYSDGTQYPKNYLMTTGVDLHVKSVPIPETMDTVELFLYDIAGKELFYDQVENHLDEAATLMIVYDVTNDASFTSCKNWIKNVRNKNPDAKLPSVLVANKVDLQERRVITSDQGKQLAKTEGMEYFETSAKELKDIETPFLHLAVSFHAMYQEKIEDLNQQH